MVMEVRTNERIDQCSRSTTEHVETPQMQQISMSLTVVLRRCDILLPFLDISLPSIFSTYSLKNIYIGPYPITLISRKSYSQ